MAKKLDIDSLSKKEKKEYVKDLRESQTSKGKRLRLLFIGILLVGVVLAGFGLYTLATTKDTSLPKELGVAVTPLAAPNDHLHVKKNEPHVAYNSNPPTNGPHYNGTNKDEGIGPIPCQTYTQEVEDESAVHNLEHGAVWVTYKDINDTALADKLKKITENYSKVLLSPRSKDDSKIAVVSWNRLLKLDNFDETKITDFIKLYQSSEAAGAERYGECGTVSPF